MTAKIFARNKQMTAIVDDDNEDLAELCWSVSQKYFKHGGKYLLHRVIMARTLNRELASTELVNWIDGNRLNNTRANLEIVTRAESNTRAANRRRTRKYPQYTKLIRKLRWTNDWIVLRDGSFHPTEEDAVIHMRHKNFIR